MAKAAKKLKKKNVKVEPQGCAYIQATFNNIIITMTNKAGQVISWCSAGKSKFRGSKKNTPYASQVSAERAAKEAHEMGLRKVEVIVRGPGSGREAAIRALSQAGLEILNILDKTPLPHNGCRPPKRRRV